jgi:hypothetical protein
MSKAATRTTTSPGSGPIMTRLAAVEAEKAADAPTAPDDTWLRFMAPIFETDQGWAARDPISKIIFAVSGAADQISGLAEICWSLNFADMRQGSQWTGERGLRHPYGFIAKTLSDVARGLREANKLYGLEMDRQDDARLKAGRRAAA